MVVRRFITFTVTERKIIVFEGGKNAMDPVRNFLGIAVPSTVLINTNHAISF